MWNMSRTAIWPPRITMSSLWPWPIKQSPKKILAAAGFPVPAGAEFSSLEEGLAYYPLIKDRQIVVKPKSTNFDWASLSSKNRLVWKLMARLWDCFFRRRRRLGGGIHRWNGIPLCLRRSMRGGSLARGGQCRRRRSAYRRELIAIKNDNPLRGRDHRSPLEIIELGDIELLMLDQQGYGPDDILPAGVKVDLRRNSNISTGGDSIDVTDSMHTSYKELAADMAKAMGAWACGVDLIIPDSSAISIKENPNCTCIELNFNPLCICTPIVLRGRGQSITPKILAKLFPRNGLIRRKSRELSCDFAWILERIEEIFVLGNNACFIDRNKMPFWIKQI